ncbi:MAG TPA: hypothetical protein VG054_04670, partial [Acidimicrobiales bacterium]|nr:hypothetical protein [Acidimicrobiales bacterium]
MNVGLVVVGRVPVCGSAPGLVVVVVVGGTVDVVVVERTPVVVVSTPPAERADAGPFSPAARAT